jgi:hypothetical protein
MKGLISSLTVFIKEKFPKVEIIQVEKSEKKVLFFLYDTESKISFNLNFSNVNLLRSKEKIFKQVEKNIKQFILEKNKRSKDL